MQPPGRSFLLRYMATSAFLSNVLPSWASSGNTLTPMLAET